MKKPILERIVTAILVVLLVLIGNPFMFWKPSMTFTIMLVIIAALVFAWIGFFLSESAEDEREVTHRTHAGRASYMSAAIVLAIALVYQGFTDTIDIWIPFTLAVMIVAKLGARFLVEQYH
jgi:small-conductance mechanosensitive channel